METMKSDKILSLQKKNLMFMQNYINRKNQVELFSDEYYLLEELIDNCANRHKLFWIELKKELEKENIML